MAAPSVERINALTQNARSTWFALLSVLLFVGITLMGVSDIDFYGVDRATQLPLINVSVPTPLFFYAAPILTATVYSYFHLYLIRLWDALADAPTRVVGRQLSDAVSPWLITDAALFVRRLRRKDNSAKRRPLEIPSALLNILLAWGGGWLILGFVWLQSLPAREFWMTAIAAASFLAALWAGLASLIMAWLRLGPPKEVYRVRWWTILARLLFLILFVPGVFAFSYLKTEAPDQWPSRWIETWPQLTKYFGEEPTDWLAELNLSGEDIVERPTNWLPYEIARKDFLAIWCKRETPACKEEPEPEGFIIEWHKRVQNEVSILQKAYWDDSEGFHLAEIAGERPRPDFRFIKGSGAFLPGSDLTSARMKYAALNSAELRGVNLSGAVLTSATLANAEVQLADFSIADLSNASFNKAQVQEALFLHTKMDQTKLRQANLHAATISFTAMKRPTLVEANLMRASLRYTLLEGAFNRWIRLKSTNLEASINTGGALRFVNFSDAILDYRTDWRNVFFDGSVQVPEEMRDRIGQNCLWSWRETNPTPLVDQEFYGRWRGWLTLDHSWEDFNWSSIAPPEYRDVTPIPPPADCKWITDPLPGAAKN